MAPVLLLIGFTAVIAQVVLLRELMVVFTGNEVSLGIALAGWLLWTAAGSAAAGRLAARVKDPRSFMAALELATAAALPLSVAAVRAVRPALRVTPGEMLGPVPIFFATLVVLSVFCSLSGGAFSAGSRLHSAERASSTAVATGTVYLLEAAGSAAGGVLASLALLPFLDSVQITFLLSALNLIASAWLVRRYTLRIACALLVLPALAVWLGTASRSWPWRGFELVTTRDSVYGNLAVIGAEGSRSVYENGLPAFTVPDPESAEEAVHYALLEHPRPESLLLIGGGLNGSLAEALKHASLRRIDYVELDPAVFELAERHLPEVWAAVRAEPRIRLHHADGRRFVQSANGSFDLIVVSLGDPRTAQLNRFYTLEFFRQAASRLNTGGILSFRLTGAENYISPQRAEFLKCIHKTLLEAFPEVVIIPGSTIHFFAAASRGALTAGASDLAARLAARGLAATYVRASLIPFRMSPDRMQEIQALIRPDAGTPLNKDFAPIAYFHNQALWAAQFHRGSAPLAYWTAGAVLILVLLLAAARRCGGAPGVSVAAMGFTQLGLEILLLLGFQAVHGYVYGRLAAVIAAFMAGMALGSWRALRSGASFGLRHLVILQLLAAFSGLAVCALLNAGQLAFPALALLCGSLGGYQFVAASRLARTAGTGTLYALDLAGSAVAAILFGVYLIPVFGFFQSAAVIAAVNLAAVASSGLRKRAQ